MLFSISRRPQAFCALGESGGAVCCRGECCVRIRSLKRALGPLTGHGLPGPPMVGAGIWSKPLGFRGTRSPKVARARRLSGNGVEEESVGVLVRSW